jgi:hypothetical protein
MPDWAAFAFATAALTLLLLYFTRRSQRLLDRARIVDSRSEVADGERGSEAEALDADAPPVDAGDTDVPPFEARDPDTPPAESDDLGDANDDRPVLLTTRLLLVNAATSQATGLAVLAVIAWWTAVPATAFGLDGSHPMVGVSALASLGTPGHVALGVTAGIALAAGNEGAARLGTRIGVTPSDRLRAAMAPGTAGEWGLLLGVALPIVAVSEEALFRGALVGALAGLFVVTGSLLVPVVAHYVVNAAEFVVHERP